MGQNLEKYIEEEVFDAKYVYESTYVTYGEKELGNILVTVNCMIKEI
jgi:hypothetical protein